MQLCEKLRYQNTDSVLVPVATTGPSSRVQLQTAQVRQVLGSRTLLTGRPGCKPFKVKASVEFFQNQGETIKGAEVPSVLKDSRMSITGCSEIKTVSEPLTRGYFTGIKTLQPELGLFSLLANERPFPPPSPSGKATSC